MISSLEQVLESRLTWPDSKPRAAQRVGTPFKTEIAKATQEIEYELARWGVRQWIISRNNQRVFAGDPGVALWWNKPPKKRGDPVELRVLACDKYQTLAANMHALYLTLNAMRALERWGAYTLEQAAEGARPALPPPGGMEVPDWRKTLGWIEGLSKDKQLVLCEHAYRSMARESNGDEAKLRVLNAAIERAREELKG